MGWFRRLVRSVKRAFHRVVRRVRSTFRRAFTRARSVFSRAKRRISRFVSRVRHTVRKFTHSVRNRVRSFFHRVKSHARAIATRMRNALSRAYHGLRSFASRAKKAVGSFISRVKHYAGRAYRKVVSWVRKAKRVVKGVVSRVIGAVRRGIGRAWDGLKNGINTVVKAVKTVGNSIPSFVRNNPWVVPAVTVPLFVGGTLLIGNVITHTPAQPTPALPSVSSSGAPASANPMQWFVPGRDVFNPNAGSASSNWLLVLVSGLGALGGIGAAWAYSSYSSKSKSETTDVDIICHLSNNGSLEHCYELNANTPGSYNVDPIFNIGSNNSNNTSSNEAILPTLEGTLGTLIHEGSNIPIMWKIFSSTAGEFTYNGAIYAYNPSSHTIVLKDGVINPSISTLHAHGGSPYHTNIRYGAQNYHIAYTGDPTQVNTKYLDYRTVVDNKLNELKSLGETGQLTKSSASSLAEDVVTPRIFSNTFLAGLGKVTLISAAISIPYRAYQVYMNESTPEEAIIDVGEDVVSAGIGYTTTEVCLGLALPLVETGPGAILAFVGCVGLGAAAGYGSRVGMEYIEDYSTENGIQTPLNDPCYIQLNTKQTISGTCANELGLNWSNTYTG